MVQNNEETYKELCLIHGEEDIDKFLEILNSGISSTEIFAQAYKIFGTRAHSVVEQLGFMGKV